MWPHHGVILTGFCIGLNLVNQLAATVGHDLVQEVPSLLHAGAEPALIESGQYRGLFSH